MALAIFRPTETSHSIALFGKLPHRPDHLRINASHPACLELDDLLERAMNRLGRSADCGPQFDAADPVDMAFLTHDHKWAFLGSMVPSKDQSDRRYPLVGGLLVPGSELLAQLCLMPIGVEIFFSQLRLLLQEAKAEATDAMACQEFLRGHADSSASGLRDTSLSQELLNRHLREESAGVLEPALKAQFENASLHQAILNLMFYGDFLRRFGAPPVIQEVRLPLPQEPGEVPLHASAWLTILQAAWGGNIQSFGRIWALRRGTHSSLHLFPGGPSENFMASLLGADPLDRACLDLGIENRAWTSHRLYAETAYAFDRFFSDPIWRLIDLLDFIRETGKRITSA